MDPTRPSPPQSPASRAASSGSASGPPGRSRRPRDRYARGSAPWSPAARICCTRSRSRAGRHGAMKGRAYASYPQAVSVACDPRLVFGGPPRPLKGCEDMPTIDGQRVVADLRRLAEFGRYKTGVHRPTYSPVDVESRHWLADKFRDAGLDTVIDGIGNVIGRNPRVRRRLLVGSHSETQPYGGWLDGSLGVIYGLELARVFDGDAACVIEVAAWADEEGHYGNYLGSSSFKVA